MTWLPGAGSSAAVYGQAAVDFGEIPPIPTTITVAVVDAGVSAGSKIVVAASIGAGRDTDEIEMDGVMVSVGGITPGVGFNLIVDAPAISSPHGAYLLNYSRS